MEKMLSDIIRHETMKTVSEIAAQTRLPISYKIISNVELEPRGEVTYIIRLVVGGVE